MTKPERMYVNKHCVFHCSKSKTIHGSTPVQIIIYHLSKHYKGFVYFNYTYRLLFIALFDDFNRRSYSQKHIGKNKQKKSTDNDIFWIQDIIILYDHNTYFLSSPVCQSCLIDLYKKLTEHFRPELFDDSDTVH